MRSHHTIGYVLLTICCLGALSSCKISDDANAAAKQLTTTSTDLANYYGALSTIVSADIALNDLQTTLQGIPFPDEDRARLNVTSSELQKRADIAKSLQSVATAFSGLATSTSPTDVSNAASQLETKLTSLNVLPQPKGVPISLPATIGEAGKLIVSLIQQHQEKKIAPALDKTLDGLTLLFSQEMEVYDSLNSTYLTLAASLAKHCIDQRLANGSPLLTPALQPFGLTVSSSADTAFLNAAIETQIDATAKGQIVEHQNASKAMADAIKEMNARVHQLASGGHMPSRGTPVTLGTVEKWISTANTYANTYLVSSSSTGSTPKAATPAKK